MVVGVAAGAVVVVVGAAVATVVVVVGFARLGGGVVVVGFARLGGGVVVGVVPGRRVGTGAAVDVEPPWGSDLAASSCRAWTSARTIGLAMEGAMVVVSVLAGAPIVVVVSVARTGVGSASSSRSAPSSEAPGSPSEVATTRSGDAEIPSAVGASVTSLRTLPTAAAAIVTATTVATNHAIPMPPNLLIPIVWYRFPDTAIVCGRLSILLV